MTSVLVIRPNMIDSLMNFERYVNIALKLIAGSVQIKIPPVIELFCGELTGSLTIQGSVRWLLAAVAFSSPLQSG